MDHSRVLCVGGIQQNCKQQYNHQHSIILHGKCSISKLIINTEHTRLLHAGPLLMSTSLGCHFTFWEDVEQFALSYIIALFANVDPLDLDLH